MCKNVAVYVCRSLFVYINLHSATEAKTRKLEEFSEFMFQEKNVL